MGPRGSNGKVRGAVVFDMLVGLGLTGSERTTRELSRW